MGCGLGGLEVTEKKNAVPFCTTFGVLQAALPPPSRYHVVPAIFSPEESIRIVDSLSFFFLWQISCFLPF